MQIKSKTLSVEKSNNIHNKSGSHSGFTLIEVLISITILAIMSLPILSSFMSSSKINLKARQQEHANTVGQKVSENYKSLSLTQLLRSMNEDDIVITTSAMTGQKVYTFNMGCYDANGNAYNDASPTKGDKFYVQVELNPDDFSDKLDAEEASKDNANNNINSYNMPSFSELKDDKCVAIMTQIYEHDESAPGSLVLQQKNVYRKADVYVDITDKVPGTNTINISPEGYKIYTQTVKLQVRYCVYGNPGKYVEYSYDMGSTAIRGNHPDDEYKSVFVFYNPFDKFRNDSNNDKSRDNIAFHVNEGDATDMKFNPDKDSLGNPMKDKKVNLYLVEQQVTNVNDSSVKVKLQNSNIAVYVGSSFSATGVTLAKNLGIGANKNVNILTNASCIQTYKDDVVLGSGKTFGNTTNSLTQDMDPNLEIKYLYNMTVKIWINEAPDGGNDPFLTLQSTKENAYQTKETESETETTK